MLFGDADVVVAFRDFLFEDIELGSARHGGGDGEHLLVLLGKVGDGAAENFGVGGSSLPRWLRPRHCRVQDREICRASRGRLIAAAFFGDDMQDDGFLLLFEILESLDEEFKIMSIDGSKVAKTKFLEQDVGKKKVLRGAFDFVGELAD